MLEGITHKSFEDVVGDTVELSSEEASFTANVESVTLLRQDPNQERQPFSVVLQAHDGRNHGQRTYQLSHPDLGVMSLFLVPIGPDDVGMCYEIIFN